MTSFRHKSSEQIFFDKCRNRRFLVFILMAIFVCYGVINFDKRRTDIFVALEDIYLGATSQGLFTAPDENICHIPNLDPFDESILKYVRRKVHSIDCTKRTVYNLLFQITWNGTLELAKNAGKHLKEFKSCCYSPFDPKKVLRYEDDCTEIHAPLQLSPQEEFISIYCTKKEISNKKENTPILVDLLHFTPLKREVEASVTKIRKKLTNKMPQVNVILFGIDAVSHLNFQRTMPKSREYLMESLSAAFLNGYTKVADNTFPNLVPVLTGLNVDELTQKCWPTKMSYFDSCHFIWQNYSAAGYRTSFSEDAVWMGVFNYMKRGFQRPPTDYFLNDFMSAGAKSIGHWQNVNAKLCYGPRLGFQILLDNVERLAAQMGQSRRYFQFTWATSISHDSLNYPAIVDGDLMKSLKFLQEGGYLNQSVLLLTSDHGIRYGRIRTTFQGKVEENMPFLYAVFPPWFKKQYSGAVGNLFGNRQKLTTPFDLHEMLKDLLHLDSITNERIQMRQNDLNAIALPRGISPFLEIPSNRTCEQAAIEDTYCVCHSTKPVSVESPEVDGAVNAALASINGLLKPSLKCSTLKLSLTMAAYSVELSRNSSNLRENKPEEYIVLFRTTPGNAIFEATMASRKVNADEAGKEWNVAGDISRVNAYGNQSHCVDDYNLKKYCYCLE